MVVPRRALRWERQARRSDQVRGIREARGTASSRTTSDVSPSDPFPPAGSARRDGPRAGGGSRNTRRWSGPRPARSWPCSQRAPDVRIVTSTRANGSELGVCSRLLVCSYVAGPPPAAVSVIRVTRDGGSPPRSTSCPISRMRRSELAGRLSGTLILTLVRRRTVCISGMRAFIRITVAPLVWGHQRSRPARMRGCSCWR